MNPFDVDDNDDDHDNHNDHYTRITISEPIQSKLVTDSYHPKRLKIPQFKYFNRFNKIDNSLSLDRNSGSKSYEKCSTNPFHESYEVEESNLKFQYSKKTSVVIDNQNRVNNIKSNSETSVKTSKSVNSTKPTALKESKVNNGGSLSAIDTKDGNAIIRFLLSGKGNIYFIFLEK